MELLLNVGRYPRWQHPEVEREVFNLDREGAQHRHIDGRNTNVARPRGGFLFVYCYVRKLFVSLRALTSRRHQVALSARCSFIIIDDFRSVFDDNDIQVDAPCE